MGEQQALDHIDGARGDWQTARVALDGQGPGASTSQARGEIDRYSWVDVGSSYVMSDVLAAFLLGQLEHWREIQLKRAAIWDTYHRELSDWAKRHGVRQPVVPEHCSQAYHLYYLLLPSHEARAAFITHLRERGILAVFHYLPLNVSPVGQRFGGRPGSCPVAESLSQRLVRLPFFNSLGASELDEVISAVVRFHP